MKKEYLVVAIILMLLGINCPKALTVGDCKVLASFKLSSSKDSEKYICKGNKYGEVVDDIYYSGSGETIVLNNVNIYYFTNWDEYDVTVELKGKNNISMLHLSDSKFKVNGSGSLKFKQNSFVKKVINGESVYNYVYKDKTVLNEDKKIYEGTTLEFEENYELLKEINKLPEEYHLEDFVLDSVADYSKMTSVVVTESWIDEHIDTELNTSLIDGFGYIEYVEPKKEEKKETKEEKKKQEENQLETENVILISDKKIKKQYKLKEEPLLEKEVAIKVNESIPDKDLVSFYDVSVYNGKKAVPMKNGKYTLKIKLDSNIDCYENYQIIYVSDDGEIEEYIDGVIEDGYIVFETTHLSQYGVIASPVVEELEIDTIHPVKKNSVNLGNVFKISILLFIIIVTICLITVILLKSGLLANKKKRKRRA